MNGEQRIALVNNWNDDKKDSKISIVVDSDERPEPEFLSSLKGRISDVRELESCRITKYS